MREPRILALYFLLMPYLGILLTLYLTPHRLGQLGRMELHQFYAHAGQVLSFGCIDNLLTDWYYVGETWNETTAHYDAIVLRSIQQLTPVWLGWTDVIVWAVGRRANPK